MIEPDGVGALQPSHAGDQVGVGGFQHQVVVIAHEAIRVNLPTGLLTSFGQRLEEVVSIHVIQEKYPHADRLDSSHGTSPPGTACATSVARGESATASTNLSSDMSSAKRTMLWVDPFYRR